MVAAKVSLWVSVHEENLNLTLIYVKYQLY